MLFNQVILFSHIYVVDRQMLKPASPHTSLILTFGSLKSPHTIYTVTLSQKGRKEKRRCHLFWKF